MGQAGRHSGSDTQAKALCQENNLRYLVGLFPVNSVSRKQIINLTTNQAKRSSLPYLFFKGHPRCPPLRGKAQLFQP